MTLHVKRVVAICKVDLKTDGIGMVTHKIVLDDNVHNTKDVAAMLVSSVAGRPQFIYYQNAYYSVMYSEGSGGNLFTFSLAEPCTCMCVALDGSALDHAMKEFKDIISDVG